jgi:hypothetical protein
MEPSSDKTISLVPTASEELSSDNIPLPWWWRWEENMSCSPVDVVTGRLFPSMLCVSMALMVMPSMRVPAQDGTATPSKGGREGIVGTSVSHCPEANCQNASYLYYTFRRKRNNTPKSSTAQVGQFYCFFKQANDAMAMPPPPR